jgi:hypothetical protein
MKHLLRWLIAALLVLAAPLASATFHSFQIDELYSNADSSVQYLVLHEAAGFGGQNFLGGHMLTSTHGGPSKMFSFGTDLPNGATAGKRVLIATQGFAALGLVAPDYVIPNGFLATDGGTVNYADVDQVTYASLPTDGIHAIDRNGNVMQNVATNFAGQSASASGPPATVNNYQGLWWNAPAGSESGWGINFAHQGEVIFASWFTYDLTGKGLWLVMTAPNTGSNIFSGTLLQVSGPAFDAVPFDPNQIVGTPVGSGTLTFTDANSGTFAYTVNGISQNKAITRQVFGPLPSCIFSAQNNLAAAINYTDLWWKAPTASESGWGINFTHQGDTIFATWFTYDHDHTPMWLVVTANKSAPGTYSGTLFRTTGPAFNAVPFNPMSIVGTNVGTAMFTFIDGNTANFAYTVNGVSQTKAITRQVFRPPGTVCQ